jgi:hypothetical protein
MIEIQKNVKINKTLSKCYGIVVNVTSLNVTQIDFEPVLPSASGRCGCRP